MKRNLFSANFSLIVVGQIISLFGSSIQRFALSLYVLDKTGSASIFANILALSIIPTILIAPISGSIADNYNKKNTMIILDIISGAILFISIFFMNNGYDSLSMIATLMIALSIISSIYHPTVQSSIPIIVKTENLMAANAVVGQVSSISNFIGPIIAGVVYGFLGIKAVMILNAISFSISAILELFLKIPFSIEKKKSLSLKVLKNDMRDSINYLKNDNPKILYMICTSASFNLFLVPVFSICTPYILKVVMNVSPQLYGLSEGIIAMGMIIGAFIVSLYPYKFKINKVYKILFTITFSLIFMSIAIYTPFLNNVNILSFASYTLGAMFIMLALGMANVVTMEYTQRVTPNDMLGKITAFATAFSAACVPIGQIIFGVLLENTNNYLYLILIIVSILSFLISNVVKKVVWNIK